MGSDLDASVAQKTAILISTVLVLNLHRHFGAAVSLERRPLKIAAYNRGFSEWVLAISTPLLIFIFLVCSEWECLGSPNATFFVRVPDAPYRGVYATWSVQYRNDTPTDHPPRRCSIVAIHHNPHGFTLLCICHAFAGLSGDHTPAAL